MKVNFQLSRQLSRHGVAIGFSTKRVTEQTAENRNKMMIELAGSITVGYASAGRQLEKLLTMTKKIIKIT